MSVSPSDDRPVLLHLHLPKTAGTTLNTWLYTQFITGRPVHEEDGKLIAGLFYYPIGYIGSMTDYGQRQVRRVFARPDLRAVLGHFHFGIHRDLPRPSAYVTVLRDPVERVVSLYQFHRLVQRRRGNLEGVTIRDGMDLEAFVKNPPYPEVDNGQTRRIAGESPPPHRRTTDLLDHAMANLDRFAVVGTTEQFDQTLVLLRQAFNLPEASAYYPKNVNTTRENLTRESDSLRELIAERNALDMALYEQAKRRLQQQIARAGEAFQQELDQFRARQQRWLDQTEQSSA